MGPLIISGTIYLVVVLLCLARPQTGRVVVGIFFWIMALGVHGYFIVANPQSYVEFAHSAYLGLYRDLASPVVEFSPRGFGVFMLVFEVTVGALILSKGRSVKFGLLAGIVFLLGITPLGKEELVNPILAAGLADLLTQDFPRSLLAMLRGRLRHQRPPRVPASRRGGTYPNEREATMAMPETQTELLYRIGFWAALVALAGAVGYMLSAFLQVFSVVNDLHDSIIAFAASLLIPVPFLLAMMVLHHTVPEEARFWTHTALAFAIVYTTYNTLNYVVQLATVIPAGYSWSFANQQGTQGPLSLLNQTPHSLFWDVDALGYIFLSLATLAALPIFAYRGPERWVRRFFLANGLIIPLFCIVYFYPGYSVPQLMFGLPWGITVPGSLFALSLFFRSKVHGGVISRQPSPPLASAPADTGRTGTEALG